jgi:hypothetical protein
MGIPIYSSAVVWRILPGARFPSCRHWYFLEEATVYLGAELVKGVGASYLDAAVAAC